MVFWGPSVIPILVFHNTSRQMICMLIVCNWQSQGTSWWEAGWNNGSQGLWIQELGLSSIDHWFWHPAGKAHCWSPCTPQTWSVAFFWQSNGLMAIQSSMCQTCCLIVLFLHAWKLCRDVPQHRYLISCTVSEMCSTWVLDILWTCVLMCSHIILGVLRSSSWSMCPSSSMEYGKLHLPSSKMQFAKRWETGSELSPPNPPKKKLWISETRLYHVCCRFKVWYLWKEYNPCSAQQALRLVSPIWSWDWSSQCTYLTMDSLA